MSKKEVFIVEDEFIVGLDLKKSIISFGFKAYDHVDTSGEAIEKLKKLNPDLVLIDIILKDGATGFKVADYARQKNIPFIFISGERESSYLEEAKSYNPKAIISKPIDNDILEETVLNILMPPSKEN